MMVRRRRDMHTGEMPYDMRMVSLPAFAVECPESLDELELRLAVDKPELLCIGPVKYMMDGTNRWPGSRSQRGLPQAGCSREGLEQPGHRRGA